jgi:hypothetical protein
MKEVKLSVRSYAKQIGVDEKSIRKAIAEGRIVKGYDKKLKKINKSAADAEYGSLKLLPQAAGGISKKTVADTIESKQKRIEQLTGLEAPQLMSGEKFDYKKLLDQVSITGETTYAQSIQKREILGVAIDRIKLEELQGALVRKVDVDKNLFALGDQLKKGLLNIPNRAMDDILAAPNKIEAMNILTLEINNVLGLFSSMSNNSQTA